MHFAVYLFPSSPFAKSKISKTIRTKLIHLSSLCAHRADEKRRLSRPLSGVPSLGGESGAASCHCQSLILFFSLSFSFSFLLLILPYSTLQSFVSFLILFDRSHLIFTSLHSNINLAYCIFHHSSFITYFISCILHIHVIPPKFFSAIIIYPTVPTYLFKQ